jgi:hypothetical protein
MEHVMSHAPGYPKLMKWTDVDIMPTPAGEGMAMQLIANTYKQNVIGVGLGGATTNVYSVFNGRFVRSVSANLGMSYSICNVMKESGLDNIIRWIPFDISQDEVRNTLRNKMIRPTTIPQTLRELIIEHSVAREALRLGLEHHRTIATSLRGARGASAMERGITTQGIEWSYIQMKNIDIIAGTGGLLSHAPKRVQSMLIMNDAFQSEGITQFFQDSVFMMPHLGVVSTVHQDAAWNVFDKDCLIRLGSVIAPGGQATGGSEVMEISLEIPDGETLNEKISWGEIKHISLQEREKAKVTIKPARGFDIGLGERKEMTGEVEGGIVGIILDGRGRPLNLPDDPSTRKKQVLDWWESLGLYQEDFMELVEK